MDKLKKFFTDKAIQKIIAVVIIAAGVFLLAKPGTSLVTICYFFGAASLLKGISYLIKTRLQDSSKAGTVSGVGFIVAAVILFLHPQFLLSIIPVIVGICILVYGIVSLFSNLRKSLAGKIISAIFVIIGIAVIVAPFKFAEAVTSIIGLALIAVGVMIIVAQFTSRKYARIQNAGSDNDGYREVDFTDVDD